MENDIINLRELLLRVEAANNLLATRIDAAGLSSSDPIRSAQVRVRLNLEQFHMAASGALEVHGPGQGISPSVWAPKTQPD